MEERRTMSLAWPATAPSPLGGHGRNKQEGLHREYGSQSQVRGGLRVGVGSGEDTNLVRGDDPDVPLAALIPVHQGRAWLSHCPLDG